MFLFIILDDHLFFQANISGGEKSPLLLSSCQFIITEFDSISLLNLQFSPLTGFLFLLHIKTHANGIWHITVKMWLSLGLYPFL